MTQSEEAYESSAHMDDGVSARDLRALLREQRSWRYRINRQDEIDDERLLQVVDDIGTLVEAVRARAAS